MVAPEALPPVAERSTSRRKFALLAQSEGTFLHAIDAHESHLSPDLQHEGSRAVHRTFMAGTITRNPRRIHAAMWWCSVGDRWSPRSGSHAGRVEGHSLHCRLPSRNQACKLVVGACRVEPAEFRVAGWIWRVFRERVSHG